MPADKPTELSRIKLKKTWTRQQQAFSPLDLTASWLSNLALAIYMFVVVNFDTLAQATYIHAWCCWFWCSGTGRRYSNRKGTSCLPLLHAGFEPWRSETPNRQQTECSLTNRLSYRRSSLKLELDSLSLWWANIRPTWLHCRLAFAPGSVNIHVNCYYFLCSGTGKRFSNRKGTRLFSSAECTIRTLEVWDTK